MAPAHHLELVRKTPLQGNAGMIVVKAIEVGAVVEVEAEVAIGVGALGAVIGKESPAVMLIEGGIAAVIVAARRILPILAHPVMGVGLRGPQVLVIEAEGEAAGGKNKFDLML